jgi:hypothetical protein
MKTNKFCCDIDNIDICGQIVSILHSNGIEYIWQLISYSDERLVILSGNKFNARIIRSGLVTFLQGASLENLTKTVESILDKSISDFPKILSLVETRLFDKKLIYLFNDKQSTARKSLTDLINQEVAALS